MSRDTLMMVKGEVIEKISLDEFCVACAITPDFVEELLAYGIIEPALHEAALYFHADQLKRVHKLLRLQEDLEINLAGAALALQLLDELEQLRHRVWLLERHF